MMSATETVVVDDANAAHALIGRSIGRRTIDRVELDAQAFVLSHDMAPGGDLGTALAAEVWGTPVVVDALPPVTEWVHLDDVKDRKLPGEELPVHGVGTFNSDWIWWPRAGDNQPLTVVDHMVEVLAETPAPEPDTVSVRDAARALLKALDQITFSPALVDREMDTLQAALAAEGDEG